MGTNNSSTNPKFLYAFSIPGYWGWYTECTQKSWGLWLANGNQNMWRVEFKGMHGKHDTTFSLEAISKIPLLCQVERVETGLVTRNSLRQAQADIETDFWDGL